MRRLILILSLVVLCLASHAAPFRQIKGRVVCNGAGVEGVWVSDGESFAQTDRRGEYNMVADLANGYVFVCLPSGFESPVVDGIAQFFTPLNSTNQKFDFELLRRKGDDKRHGFIAIADPQIWAEKEFARLKTAADDIAATVRSHDDLSFHGLCCGDVVSFDHKLYGQYNRVIGGSGITFRTAPGNHDMTLYGHSQESSMREFEAFFGPAYHSFDRGEVHYVVLNDNFYIGRDYFYIGYLDGRQLAWLKEDLSHLRAGQTVVVCLHIPSSCTPEDRAQFKYSGISTTMTNHAALHELLKPFRAHIISGHTHTTYNQVISDQLYEHVTPAISGAWWQGPLCTDGTPSGYGVYMVDGGELSWYYKSTGYHPDHQMVIYSGTEHDEFKGYAVANIWASDPSWSVEFFIDGQPAAPAERFVAYDPIAKSIFASSEGFDHKGIQASPSGHFYRTPLKQGAQEIEVRAKDRFGDEYRARINLK